MSPVSLCCDRCRFVVILCLSPVPTHLNTNDLSVDPVHVTSVALLMRCFFFPNSMGFYGFIDRLQISTGIFPFTPTKQNSTSFALLTCFFFFWEGALLIVYASPGINTMRYQTLQPTHSFTGPSPPIMSSRVTASRSSELIFPTFVKGLTNAW